MKKRFSVIFLLVAFILSMGVFTSFKKITANAKGIFDLESQSAYLIDASTGTVVYEKDATKHLPIASMCKIMTLLLSFEHLEENNIDVNNTITVSEKASGMGGSQVFLEANADYKICDLIESVTVASANDASVALAEFICGSESAFVEKMNQKCIDLGMNNTVFVNCTGLPCVGQYSCAMDVSKMFSELIKHNEYFNYSTIWMDKIQHPNDRVTEISNTNKLIRFYKGCDCGKTGYTAEAGHCICASALKNGTRLISVIIHAPDSKTRFNEVSKMFDYGFSNYVTKIIVDDKAELNEVANVTCGHSDTVKGIPEKPIYIFSEKNVKHNFEINVVYNDNLSAPIVKGDIIGRITVYENGVEYSTVNIISIENVEKASYFDSVNNISKNWAI